MYRNGMSYKDAGYLGYLVSKKTHQDMYKTRIEEYNSNPNTCKCCHNPLPYKKRNHKFCSSSCAARFNNLNRDKSIFEKQRNTLIKTLSSKQKELKELKEQKSDIVVKTKRNKKLKYCKQCGAIKGQCKDPFVCGKHQLYNTLEKFGFDKSTIGTENVIDEFYRIKNEIGKFYILYSSNSKELKRQFNYTSGSANFIKILNSLGIDIKSHSEATIEAYLTGRNINNSTSNNYQSEWHTTWMNTEVYLRSSYEKEYAEYLDKEQIKYDVECFRIKYFDTIQNKYRCAIPDFYLPETNTIVEIKSSWTLKGKVQEMKDKFEEYQKLGYNTKFILDKVEIDLYSITE